MAAGEEYDSDGKEKMRELISKKLRKEKSGDKAAEHGGEDEEKGKTTSRRYAVQLLCFFFCPFSRKSKGFLRQLTDWFDVRRDFHGPACTRLKSDCFFSASSFPFKGKVYPHSL